jgi:hypothetical protein
MDWKAKVYAATSASKLGAIIACALDVQRDAVPRFEGKAVITSDGFLICNFVTRHGEHHMGALVGSIGDLDKNIEGLIRHLALKSDEAEELTAAVTNWIATDYRDMATACARRH